MIQKFKSGFEILRCSDSNFNKMTTLILFNGEDIAQLSMENGFVNLEIEFFTEFIENTYKPKFQIAELLEAIESAKKHLNEYT